ncbi:MAG TPA: patatin family protein [Candidatus Acetothermia bacterium]|nr:patatin family protein [Candidatus Acetothermia bacterium]
MRRTLGVALGGGGARGFAHVGVLLELERAGLRPKVVAGTSMGAIVGAMYAVGQDLEKLMQVLEFLDLREIFGITESYRRMLEELVLRSLVSHLRRGGEGGGVPERLLKLYSLLRLLCKGKRFEDLEVPFAAVAADLLTGEEVVIRQGPLYRGVAASAALPGVFAPVRWRGRRLIDGGVVNNLPVDVAAELGAEVVLAVEVSAPLKQEVNSTVEVILQSYAITSKELVRAKLELARTYLDDRVVVIRPRVEGIGVLEFHRLEEAFAAGREAAAAVIGRLRKLLD